MKPPLRFNAETNLLMYERQHNMLNEHTDNTSLKETIIRTKGDVTGAINDQQSVTIALAMNNFLYSGYTKNISTGDEYFKNYTTLLLNPYYELDNDDWKLHVGANVDLSFGFDKTFRVSPDITAQYIFSDSYVVYAKATGGKLLNDFPQIGEYLSLWRTSGRPSFFHLGICATSFTIHTNKLMVRSDSRPVLIREYGSIYTEATRT